jgi:S-sulfo-L-cysteine synthase (O-acetyl-L-serine-dependent)
MSSTEVAPRSAERRGVVELIGHTPLVRLARIEREVPGVELYAKAEWQNPGGSVKDRPAWWMIREGLRTGALSSNRRLLDATSGNTGIAYAMIGAAMGFGVTLCIPSNVTPERKRILRAYGAELLFTDPMEASDGAILAARALYAQYPDRYFYPDQYNNELNWRAHYDTTGPEIVEQTGGRLTHFVAGLGTSGTFIGVGRYLRNRGSRAVLASVQPDSPLHGLEGLKHMESAIVPGIYDSTLADIDLRASTEEAYRLTRRLAREEGLLVGISSGANLAGALALAHRIDLDETPSPVIVVIFCDGGEKYLSEHFWDEPDDDETAAPQHPRDQEVG